MPICPTCKRALPEGAYEPPFPFCSQRCKLIDLGAWLSNRYVVSEACPEQITSEDELGRLLEDEGQS